MHLFLILSARALRTSAYYDAAKELKTITKISSSDEWQEYFMTTLRDSRKHT
jgi:hypothetical protein